MNETVPAMPVVFIPALLYDEQQYRDVISAQGEGIVPHVLMSPQPRLEDSVADILERAPAHFGLVGTSCGGIWPAVWRRRPTPWSTCWQGFLCTRTPSPRPRYSRSWLSAWAGRLVSRTQGRAHGVRREAEPRVGGLKMPALVLWGEQDALVPVAVGEAPATALPNAQFEVLPECGHLPTLEKPVEAPALFAKLSNSVEARAM